MKDIFTRLKEGIPIPMDDEEYFKIGAAVEQTRALNIALNQAVTPEAIRTFLSEITGNSIHISTRLFTPFTTNFGKHITLGKNVFINHGCSFLDLGGIYIEDDVMIGPGVTISSEGHPVTIKERKALLPSKVHIQQNAWIGAKATILAGVTVGKNAVVAAGAVVTKNVPENTVVAGVPARIIKKIKLVD